MDQNSSPARPVDGAKALSLGWVEAEGGGARMERGPGKLSFNWSKRLGPLSNRKRLRHHLTRLGGRPRKFEMGDGLLAGGGLGSEAMAPERTRWSAEEHPAPLEKGEYPPSQAGGAAAFSGPCQRRPGVVSGPSEGAWGVGLPDLAGLGGGGGWARP